MNRIIDFLCTLMMWGGGLAAIAMMVHIGADIIGRVVFNNPVSGTIEIVSAYYMVGITFLPLGYVARHEGHIVVELFTRGLSHRRLGQLEKVTMSAALVYSVVFTWMTGDAALAATLKGEVWESAQGFTTVWPSRWLLPAGFGVMSLYLFWRVFGGLMSRR